MDWASQRQSLAQHFAEQAENASNYLLSSRASRRLHEEGDQAADEIERFKVEIEKRFLLSVANKFYSFPYTELSFDNPFEDQDLTDMIGRGIYSLYSQSNPEISQSSIPQARSHVDKIEEKESIARTAIEQLRSERAKLSQILELIANRKSVRAEEKKSHSKQRKLGYKYGVIKEEDEELLRKRLYTEPYEKQAGFIVKKK